MRIKVMEEVLQFGFTSVLDILLSITKFALMDFIVRSVSGLAMEPPHVRRATEDRQGCTLSPSPS